MISRLMIDLDRYDGTVVRPWTPVCCCEAELTSTLLIIPSRSGRRIRGKGVLILLTFRELDRCLSDGFHLLQCHFSVPSDQRQLAQ